MNEVAGMQKDAAWVLKSWLMSEGICREDLLWVCWGVPLLQGGSEDGR